MEEIQDTFNNDTLAELFEGGIENVIFNEN